MAEKPTYEELEKRIQELEQLVFEKTQVEEKLLEEKYFNQTLLLSAPVLFVAINAEGKTIMINKTMLDLLGYKYHEVVGKDYLTTFVPERNREELSKIFAALIKFNKPTLNENYITTKDGKALLIEWHGRSVFNKKGEFNFFFGLGIDITDRKKTEVALGKSEENYRNIYTNAQVGFARTQISTGKVLACNDKMARIFNYENTADFINEFIFSDNYVDPQLRVRLLNKLKKTEVRNNVEAEFYGKDKSKVWARFDTRIFFDKGYMEDVVVDITDQRKLETQLQQAQKMESIGTLAGGIAHDFNNILFPIVGHTEILQADLPEDSPLQGGLKEIYISALRAKELVKQILTFSRQDTNELKLMKIQPIVKEVLKLIRSTIPTTIEIKQDINPDCGTIKADPTQIHQIVMNLIANAYHAMEETGGELKISLKEVELGEYDLITPDKFDIVITDMAMPNMPGDKLSAELVNIRPDIPILLCTGFSEIMTEEKAASLGIKGFLLKPIVMSNLDKKIREVLD